MSHGFWPCSHFKVYTTQFIFIVVKFLHIWIRIVILVTRLVNCSVVPFVLSLFIYVNIYQEYCAK